MRWDTLFEDLEAEFDARREAEREALAGEADRLRVARLTLSERLHAVAADRGVCALHTAGGSATGAVVFVGADVCGVESATSNWIVPVAAITGVEFLGENATRSLLAVPAATISARIGFGYLLRDLARRRVSVAVHRREAPVLQGTIDRAAHDHLDIAIHDPRLPRRAENVTAVVTVPFAAIAFVVPEPADAFR